MSNLVFSRPLGDDLSPFGFSRCCDASWIGPAITATDNLFNRVENHWMQNRQQHFESDEAEKAYNRQRELSNELLDKQFDYSKQLWEANNDYNTPAAQVERLRDAGLNPYVYSHGSDIGTGTSGSPATTPNIGAPSVAKANSPGYSVAPTHDVGALLMAGSSLKNERMRSFAQLVEAYPKVLEACDGNVSKAEDVMRQLSGISGLKGDLPFKFATSQYEKQEADTNKARVEADLAKKYGDRQASNMIAQSEAIINESFARVRKLASDTQVNRSNIKLNAATIEKIGSEIARNVAEAWKLRKEGEKFVADAATVNSLRQFLVSQARSQSNMMDLQSLLSGSEPGTDLYDFFTSGEFMKDIKEGKRISTHWNGSPIYRGFDKFFGDYIKIMGSASVSDR